MTQSSRSFCRGSLALGALLLYSPVGLAETRLGLSTGMDDESHKTLGPEAAVRIEGPGIGFHADLFTGYSRGPTDALTNTLEAIAAAGGDEGCVGDLPGYTWGYTNLDLRVRLSTPLIPGKFRVGLSSVQERGISDGFMKALIKSCHIETEGPSATLSVGPTMGVLFEPGPVEVTVDVIYRTAIWGSDPYEWSQAPEEAKWQRGRTDYTPAVLVVPVRATVDLGPVYVRGGALAGVRFPTRNSELWHEEAPDVFDSPSNTNFWSVEAAVGASF